MTLAEFVLDLRENEKLVITSRYRQATIGVELQVPNEGPFVGPLYSLALQTNAMGLRFMLHDKSADHKRMVEELVKMRDKLRADSVELTEKLKRSIEEKKRDV